MQYSNILGKFSEYLHSASIGLSKWLESRLSSNDDWWQSCVMDKLSYNQRIIAEKNNYTKLQDLDLSALLRITDKNWYAIPKKFYLKQSERTVLKEMFTIRNKWAHFSTDTPTIDSVAKDLKTVIEFLSIVEADKMIISNAEDTLRNIKSDEIIESSTLKEPEKKELEETVSTPDITIGRKVHLRSDPNAKGVVTGIREIGATKQFDVFINGKDETFYAEQIEAEILNSVPKLTDINDILRYLTAYLINNPSAGSLYSLNTARIDFVPYQFRPALKIIKSDTPRLLIADGVGVGKTIEAGLILKELQARTPMKNILIICPKPLVVERKWESEMKRFDENFVSASGSELRNIILEADRDGEWPDKYKHLILPYSLLTEDLLEGQERKGRKIMGLKDINPVPKFDLVIVDEAHHIRNSNTQVYKAVKFFCENANAAIFMTATPIQLGNEDLFTLLNLLFPEDVTDKNSFAAMSEPNRFIISALNSLRLNGRESDVLNELEKAAATSWGQNIIAANPLYHQIKDLLSNGELTREQKVKTKNDIESFHSFSRMINRTRRKDIEDFCIRRAKTLESDFTPYQSKIHDSLLDFEEKVLKKLHGSMPVKFLMSTIRRQAASCIFGFAPSIKALKDKRFSEFSTLMCEYDIDEEFNMESAIDEVLPLAEELIKLAENLPSEDPKFDKLSEILKEKQKDDNNKIIIFSTFLHTQSYLKKRIVELGLRVEQINGSVKDEDRYQLRKRFELPKKESEAIDILLFTEVGSEGLDYQFCNVMVNYDLPWNPMRIEQRIGRIDRRGQKSEVVHIYNCITSKTIDAEIFDRCLSRIGVFEESIGECSEILGKITKSLQDIVFDTVLTESERAEKLEQLANNEVQRMQEMRKLEDEQKQMIGLDISNFTEDIGNAENPLIMPEALKSLVLGYFQNRLSNEKKYISDKRLSLTMLEKKELMEDLAKIKNNPEDSWVRFLQHANANICRIVFEQDEAKDDPKTIFVTPLHPLVRQAAANIVNNDKLCTVLKVRSTDIASGEYPFLLFAWKYTGIRPRVELVAVCADEKVQVELLAIIQSAVQAEAKLDKYVADWDNLEHTHYKVWQKKLDVFKKETLDICLFRIESLLRSVKARLFTVEQQLAQVTDSKIIAMRKSEIEHIKADCDSKKSKFEKSAEQADIHITKLVSGVLIVEE